MRACFKLRSGCFALACLLTSGCTSLPDAQPFADASVRMQGAVSQSGRAVVQELRQLGWANDQASALEEAWQHRIAAVDAVVRYSNSVAAIVAAGKKGGESVSALAGSLESLASAAGIALPGEAVIGVVTDTAKFIGAQIALVRASSSLKQALAQSQPAVDRLTAILTEDQRDLEAIMLTANSAVTSKIKFERNVEIGYLTDLESERKTLYGVIGESGQQSCPELTKALRNSPGTSGATCSVLGQVAELRISEISTLIAETADWRVPMEQNLADAELRLGLGLSLIQESQAAIETWGIAYHQLSAAVASGGRIDPVALNDSVVTINQLVRRMREL